MRRFCLNLILLLSLLIPLAGAGETSSWLNRRQFHATLFGMVCALSPQESSEQVSRHRQPLLDRNKLPKSVKDSLGVAHLLINEGGFDYAQVIKLTGPGLDASLNNPPAVLQAYKEILGESPAGGVRGLLRVVPVCLAYAQRPEEALAASALAAAVDKPVDTELRAAGRAFCIVLQGCLAGEEDGRKAIIKRAIDRCGAESVRDALRIVLTDSPLDEASTKVTDALALVLRNWYDSTSYQDAMRRLGTHAPPSRKALLGSLAGASYSVRGTNYNGWPEVTLAGELDTLAKQLFDLARDNVLLPVDEEEAIRLAASGREQPYQDKIPSPEPIPPSHFTRPVAPLPPKIVPPIPPEEPKATSPTCKDIPLFQRSP
ncbi:MAG: hypothetical protein JXA52_03600 [Planctomycetes bacterium]|nr:hypothetical protein [Planctomycetota bacterium]